MAWSNSKIFMAFVEDVLENTTAMDLNSDTFKAALYDNDVTPSQTVASNVTAYNTGQWTASGNEVADGTEWDAGGEPLTGVASGFSSNVYTFDATDTPSGGTSATLAAVFGCLVYDDTITTPVADQGVCYNYFGGTNSVTDGQFTIVWHASGIFTLTL
jgi:hypothetical protein